MRQVPRREKTDSHANQEQHSEPTCSPALIQQILKVMQTDRKAVLKHESSQTPAPVLILFKVKRQDSFSPKPHRTSVGRIIVRTEKLLFCFGNGETKLLPKIQRGEKHTDSWDRNTKV